MKALIFNTTGPVATVLQLAEVPKPKTHSDQVLVKLINSPINPADLLFIEGRYRHQPQLPQIAGLEGCGIITEVGSSASHTTDTLKEGMLVSFRARNAWAEYVALNTAEFTVLPDTFPHEKAGLFNLNPLTAYGLLQQAQLKKDDWLLLSAANSMVAKIIIQLARRQGINTIAVVRDAKQCTALKALGATVVLVATEADTTLAQQVLTLTNNIGVHAIMDAVGGPTISQLITCLVSGAQLIVYGLLSPVLTTYHNGALVLKNLTIKGFGIDQWLSEQSPDNIISIKQQLSLMLSEPDFMLPIAAKYPLESFAKAFAIQHQGKILLTA